MEISFFSGVDGTMGASSPTGRLVAAVFTAAVSAFLGAGCGKSETPATDAGGTVVPPVWNGQDTRSPITYPPEKRSFEIIDVLAGLSVEDRKKYEAMESALGNGEMSEALYRARDMMSSTNQAVRLKAIEVFEWSGKRALPEIVEMVNDRSKIVSEAALAAWQQVVDGIGGDAAKTAAVTNAVAKTENQACIDAMLHMLVDVPTDLSLPALEGVIISARGKMASVCAKEYFEFLTGEEWSSPERTLKLTKRERQK